MNSAEYLQLAANLLIRQIPTLVVAFIGLWFAVTRRPSLGRASTWAIWGFSLLVAYSFASVLLQFILLRIQLGDPRDPGRIESVSRVAIWALAAHPLFVGGLAALARAVFVNRKVTASGNHDV